MRPRVFDDSCGTRPIRDGCTIAIMFSYSMYRGLSCVSIRSIRVGVSRSSGVSVEDEVQRGAANERGVEAW